MKQQLNTKGYNLYMMALDSWVFDDNTGAKVVGGTFLSIILYAESKGFDIDELEAGIEMMLAGDYDSVHFGMYKSPIYAFDRKESKVAS